MTIGRLMTDNQDLTGDPRQAARDFVAEQLPRYLLNPGVDYWEGWNEPDPNQDMDWYAIFETERVDLLANHGLRAAVGGFSAGVPEYDEFFKFLPAIEAAWWNGGVLSLHEYGAPTIDYLYGDPLPGLPILILSLTASSKVFSSAFNISLTASRLPLKKNRRPYFDLASSKYTVPSGGGSNVSIPSTAVLLMRSRRSPIAPHV